MKLIFLVIGYFVVFSLFVSSSWAQAQPIQNWIIPTPTSLQIQNPSTPTNSLTITSTSSTNTSNIAIAPNMVLLPCSFALSSNPSISVTVAALSALASGTYNTNSSITLGYTANTTPITTYEFEIYNTVPKGTMCSNKSTEIRTYINGILNGTVASLPCYTIVNAQLILDITLVGGVYQLNLKRPGTGGFFTIASRNITPARDGQFFIKLKHRNTSNAAVTNVIGNYPCTNSTFFNELKPSLDGGFAALYDNNLRIKYIQQYATINSTTPVAYTIRNWNNSVNINGTFNAIYGINWISLPISSLPLNQFYTIEILGNKGEKSYLRFKR